MVRLTHSNAAGDYAVCVCVCVWLCGIVEPLMMLLLLLLLLLSLFRCTAALCTSTVRPSSLAIVLISSAVWRLRSAEMRIASLLAVSWSCSSTRSALSWLLRRRRPATVRSTVMMFASSSARPPSVTRKPHGRN